MLRASDIIMLAHVAPKAAGNCAEGVSPIRVSLSKAASAAKERAGPLPPPSPATHAAGIPRRLSNDGSMSNSSAGSRRGTREEPGVFPLQLAPIQSPNGWKI